MVRKLIASGCLTVAVLLPTVSYGGDIEEFARRSNIKDDLTKGDCARYGGEKAKGAWWEELKKGRKIGGRNNVVRVGNSVYVVYSYSDGLWNKIRGTHTMSACRFHLGR